MDQHLKKFWDSLFEANDRLNELFREIETQGDNEVLSRAAMLEKGFAEIQSPRQTFAHGLQPIG